MARWRARARVHPRHSTWPGAEQCAAESRSAPGEQSSASSAGRRKNRALGEDRYDELLQGLRGESEVTGRLRVLALLPVLLFLPLQPASAQSPNTSTIVVVVTDQSGAVVTDAKVSVINTQTAAVREAVAGNEGSATFPALSLTGAYNVVVSKQGFGSEERSDVMLRAGETAT